MKQGRKYGAVSVGSIMLLSLIASACSNSADKPGASTAATTAAGTTAKPTTEVAVKPLTKYDPPIEVTTVRSVDAAFKYAAGDSIDSNIWTKIFEQDYGIKVKNVWSVDGTQYHQKLNVSIASGDIPDFLEVNKEEMKRLADAGMLEDLTKVWEQYSTPFLKSLMSQDQGIGLKAATIDGKLLGIPHTFSNGGVSTAEMLYVRTDWLKKLNLPEPQSMDDVFKIATAFAKQDPDGNGKADTIGLAVNKDFLDYGHGSLRGFFNSYHAFTDIFIKDAAGKIVYGSVQKELKEPLKKLQEMYKDGILDKEFGVKPPAKIQEDVAAGRVGLAYGYVSDAGYIQKESHTKDPKAQWKAFPLLSIDSKPAVPQLYDTANTFYVVKKGSKHPEAAINLANIYTNRFYEKSYAPDPNPFITDTKTGVMPAKYAPVALDPLNLNLEAFGLVQAAIKAGDGSKLGFPASIHFDRVSKYLAGDDSQWGGNFVMGEGGSYSVIDKYSKAKLGQYNLFLAPATPTMSEKLPTIKKKVAETFTKIIMGDSSIDEFDKFADEYKKLGGDKIDQEVNDWYAKNK
ncbi:lipoprotein LipO [Paenibacillus marchantiophytorum]|uniref:Lipoprotein LipO n=1 Tax=Paenibacillus marchantiophytorum TaxID=1619310 RepID=A0ABQ1F6B0_9BACL|nr:extracellular solute-binding protein [Paenibacillus marchantiophytorum]GGA00332.1 lipoprotein LipO [Paenibacillus marchantiophytorum]